MTLGVPGIESQVHQRRKTRYRVANWASYDRALVRRGDVTVWLSPEAIERWEPVSDGRRGGQLKYSDVAIEAEPTHTVNSHINRLRSKINGGGPRQRYIETVWGVGYRFNERP